MWNGPIRFVTYQHFSSWRQFHVLVFDLSIALSAMHDACDAGIMRLSLEVAAEAAGIFRLYPVVNPRAEPASKLRDAAQQLESKGFRRARWGCFEGATHKKRADRRPVAANLKRNPVKLRLFYKRLCTASGRFYLYSARPRDSRIVT
jgi:hypothetical protein